MRSKGAHGTTDHAHQDSSNFANGFPARVYGGLNDLVNGPDCPGQIMLLYIIMDLFGNSCIDNIIAVYAVIEVYAFIQHL